MAEIRKTLGKPNSPYILSLMALIETQSKATIGRWCLACAQDMVLPVYETAYPEDSRPRQALEAARAWFAGTVKLPQAKRHILACHAAARQAEDHPAAQAAARACGQAASVIHMPAHSIGLAFYGAAAIAYARVGTAETGDAYDSIAAEVCGQMEAALAAIAVPGEPDPAKIRWRF